MGFFSSDKKITHEEFRRALSHLREHGFAEGQMHEIENLFYADLNEGGSGAGISADELKKEIHYLKEHPERHHLSGEQIGKLEEALKHYL